MRDKLALALLALLVPGVPSLAQPVLRLKSGRTPQNLVAQTPGELRLSTAALSTRTAAPARVHLILQFAAMPGAEALDRLGFQDIRVLKYVPDQALLVSAPAGVTFSDPNLLVAARLEAADKLSARFAGMPSSQSAAALVEFHPDVDPARALVLVQSAGLTPIGSQKGPYLVARGAVSALQALAANDEVAYLLPAHTDLEAGKPAIACLGGTLPGLQLAGAANLATSFGDGWDGPGQGAASLTWYLANTNAKLTEPDIAAALKSAMDHWAGSTQISFSRSSVANLRRQIDILFGNRDHGDGYNFDGPGGVLAHTFYPPPNPETLAGDLHLDLEENWQLGADVDLFSVALHELGHALGLAHNDNPESVMYPYYRRVTALHAADIAEIQKLYAAPLPTSPTEPVEPTPTDPAPTDPNPTDPTPAEPTPVPTDTTPPTLTILSPVTGIYATARPSLTVTGAARDDTAVARVEWETAAGDTGTANGTAAFSTGPIPLYTGTNQVTIRAYDAAGNMSWRSIRVVRK